MVLAGKRIHSIHVIALIGLSLSCVGCAFGDRVVALSYTPTPAVSSQGNGIAVYLAPIQDVCQNRRLRDDKGREIGDVVNGYNIRTATVVSKSMDLSPWITDALTKELHQHGFQPLQVTALPPDCELGISGSLSECYSKMKFFGGQVCTLKVNIIVHRNGAPVASKEYVGIHKGGLGVGTAAEYERIFQAAMADLMAKVMPDVVAQAQ